MTIKTIFTDTVTERVNSDYDFNDFVLECINNHFVQSAKMSKEAFEISTHTYMYSDGTKVVLKQDKRVLTVDKEM